MPIARKRALERLTVAIAALVATIRLAHAQGPLPRYELVRREPGTTVWAIAQTRDGFVWFATERGVRRFDGARVVPALDDGAGRPGFLPARRLLATRDGALWIATGGGYLSDVVPRHAEWARGDPGLLRLAHGGAAATTLTSALASPWVWALAEGRDGDVWIGTERGLQRARGGQVEPPLAGLAGVVVAGLAVDPAGVVWAATDEGVARVDREGVRKLALGPATAIVARGDGIVYATTGETLWRIGPDGPPRRIAFAGAGGLRALALAPSGELLVGGDGGLRRIGPDDVELPPLTGAEGADRPSVQAVLVDGDGSLWLGTRASGVAELRARRVWNLGRRDGVAGDVIFAVRPIDAESAWMTGDRGATLWRQGRATAFLVGDGLPLFAPRDVDVGPDGAVLVAGRERGFARWNGSRFERVPTDAPVDAFAFTSDGALWREERDAIVRHRRGDPRVTDDADVRLPDGACGRDVLALLADGTGVWAGTATGHVIGVPASGPARCAAPAPEAAGRPIIALAVDPVRHEVWVGAQGRGLARVRGERVEVFPSGAAEPLTIAGLTVDRRDGLWLSTLSGVRRLDLAAIADGRARDVTAATVVRVDGEDGMASEEGTATFHPAISEAPDGRIWVATLAGVAIIDAQLVSAHAARAPRPPVFEEVRVGGVPKPVHAPLVLGPEPRELDVSYTAPELLAPQRLTFERRLWPLEAAWSSPGAARRALLAGLRPGRYELQVRARVAGGPPSHPSTLSILVRPHVYETVWFYAVVVAALAAAALLAHRLRVRVLAARYQAVQDERLRIARDLHDGLAQGFTAIGFHVDSVRLNDEALAPRSREVLDRTRSLVDAVQTQVRSSIAQLRERGTGAVSLVAWLERVRDEIRLLGPVEVALVVRGEVPLVGAGAAHELAMIAREAGTNAVRHGHAKRVTIGLELAEGDAVLGVDDDGSGFDAAAANRGGFGVQGMRERAARLGGSVVIGRGAGGGTSVVARVPRAALAR